MKKRLNRILSIVLATMFALSFATSSVAWDPSVVPAANLLPPANIDRGSSPSLGEIYEDYFLMGNIWSSNTNYTDMTRRNLMTSQFKVITGENWQKPDNLSNGGSGTDPVANGGSGTQTFTWTNADSMLNRAEELGLKVAGHVLAWHSQSPAWLNGGSGSGTGTYTRARAKANLEYYIKTVVEHFDAWKLPDGSNRMISWDVVNEAFTDGVSFPADPAPGAWRNYLRAGSQSGWIRAYSNGMAAGESPSDFIYDAFVFARRYTTAKLIYNDFNIYFDGKARAVAQMVTELNAQYAAEYPADPRKLIEAVGMQSHNYMWDTPASAVEMGIQTMIAAGVDVCITELDLFCFAPWNGEPQGTNGTYIDLKNRTAATLVASNGSTEQRNYWADRGVTTGAQAEVAQAIRYAEFFEVYKKYAAHIDRVTFWGLRDNDSWRRNHNPLLWYNDYSPKEAYWAVAYPEEYLKGAYNALLDADTAFVTITGTDTVATGAGATASYTISAECMPATNGIEFVFEVDGSYLHSIEFNGLNGFVPLLIGNYGTPEVFWTNSGDIWTGKVTMINLAGASGKLDLFNMVFGVGEGLIGSTDVKLLSITMSASSGGPVAAQIYIDTATTECVQWYSKYDLNKDGVIDLNDLTFALQFLGVSFGDPDWEQAKICNFDDANQTIDINDLILILANYTIPYYS